MSKTFKKAVAPKSALDTAAVKELRDMCRNFVKLDLAYLVGIGSVFTALKMGKHDILNTAAGFQEVIYAFLFILFIDLCAEYVLLHEWIASRDVSAKRLNAYFVKLLTCRLQPLVHFLFLSAILVGIAAFGEGRKLAMDRYDAYGSIQLELDRFITKHGRVPKDVDELRKFEPRVNTPLKFLQGESVQIAPEGATAYRLTLSAHHHGIREDDVVITPELKAYEVNEAIREQVRNHPND